VTRLLREVLHWFWTHDGFFLAAGLSFYVVICVVPFALLLIAGGGFLLADEHVVQGVVNQLTEILPVYRPDVEQLLTGVASTRSISGFLGTAILLLFATQLFAATRFVLNRIFGVRGRGFWRGIGFDLMMILVLTVLFFVTMALTAAVAWMKNLVDVFQRGLIFSFLFEWTGLFLAVVFDTLLFMLLYRFVPTQRVRWSSVLSGSVTTALLWELAKQLFRLYIEEINVYGTMYGSLGVTIGLIMWIYYSAVVFVLGATLIRVLEERRAHLVTV
jgi:membrane protein